MEELKIKQESFFINFDDDIPGLDLKIEVRTANSMDIAIASSYAQEIINKLDESMDVCISAGIIAEKDKIDIEDPAHRQAVFQIEKIKALANRLILSWQGPVDGSNQPTPVNEITVAGLMETWPVGEIFFNRVTEWHRKVLAAKKEFGASANGTSNQVVAPYIAKDAKK